LNLEFDGQERLNCRGIGLVGIGRILVAEFLNFHELARNAA